MKKMFTVLALMITAFAAFAQMTDAQRYAKIKELSAGSKDPAKLAQVEVYDNLLNAKPANFDVIQKKFVEIYGKHKVSDTERDRALCGFTLWNFNHKFIKESYALSKAKGYVTAFWAVYHRRALLGIDDKEAFEQLAKGMVSKFVPMAIKQKVCDQLLRMAPNVDDKTVKTTLTTLNRTLTPYLLTTEKGQYENIVAKIRTMLGAY